MRPRATHLAVVLLAISLGGRAGAVPPEEARAVGSAPPAPAKAPKPPSTGTGETYVTGDDRDFEPEAPSPSIALGPVGKGDLVLSLDLGWLRSGVRADLGLGAFIDLVLRADALLLYDGFGGHDGIHLGVRFSPLSRGLLRAAAEASVGQVFVPGARTVKNLTAIRASASGGVALELATLYARGELRWLSGMRSRGPGWTQDGELGLGIERAFGKRGWLILGAEGYVWVRSRLDSLGQWRVRVGFAI